MRTVATEGRRLQTRISGGTVKCAFGGSTHRVHTGVCIFAEPYDAPAAAFVETTVVRFADIGESDIAAYIESGEPMDKAGAYGIQGTAAQFVSGLEGDYFNVVGLPVHRLSTTLAELLRSGVVIC